MKMMACLKNLLLMVCILLLQNRDQAHTSSYSAFNQEHIIIVQEKLLSGLKELIDVEEEKFVCQKANITSNSNSPSWKERNRLEKHRFQIQALNSFYDEASKNITDRRKRNSGDSDENLFSVFHTLKMFVCRWKKFLYDSPVKKEMKLMFDEVVNNTNVPVPTTQDYREFLGKLPRIQEIFNISFDSFTEGKIKNITGIGLSAADIHDIGMVAFEEKRYKAAVNWLRASILVHTFSYKREPPFNALKATLTLADAFELLQDIDNFLYYLNVASEMDSNSVALKRRLYEYEVEERRPKFERPSLENNSRLNDVCQKAFYMVNITETSNETVDDTLDCYYQSQLVPYDLLKMEIISKSPQIVLYHGIISNSDSENLMNVAEEKSQQKKVASYWQVSKIVELSDTTSKVVSKMSQRLSYITGLDTTQRPGGLSSSSNFHILDYRFADYDEIHCDAYKNVKYLNGLKGKLRGSGNRIATTMSFLTAPEEGGTVVFPNINKKVEPMKGAVLFWYNIDDNGNVDRNTYYGSCPVLFGKKQVAVKWIHEAGNNGKKKCWFRR